MLVEILTLVHLVVAAATVGLGTAWPLLASKVALVAAVTLAVLVVVLVLVAHELVH